MKKILTLALLAGALIVSTAAKAQVQFGLKAGLNVTNFSFDKEVFEKSNQAGFFVGPTVKFTLPIVGLGVDASALYDQRSAKISSPSDGNNMPAVDKKLTQNQIIIPVNLRYGIGLGSTASAFFFAGPQFGFNVGSKDKNIIDEALQWRLKESTLSVNVGVGVMLANHLQLSANYNIACGKTGEFEILNKLYETTFGKDKKNGRANAWQLSAAYFF